MAHETKSLEIPANAGSAGAQIIDTSPPQTDSQGLALSHIEGRDQSLKVNETCDCEVGSHITLHSAQVIPTAYADGGLQAIREAMASFQCAMSLQPKTLAQAKQTISDLIAFRHYVRQEISQYQELSASTNYESSSANRADVEDSGRRLRDLTNEFLANLHVCDHAATAMERRLELDWDLSLQA